MSPRLFNFVLFLLVAALLTVQLPTTTTTALFTNIYIPILLAAGVLVFVNLAIFPEISSSYLGTYTIETLSAAVDTLTRSTHWFITPGCDAPESRMNSNVLAATFTNRTSSTVNKVKLKTASHVQKFLAGFPNPFHSSEKRLAAASTMPVHLTTISFLTRQKAKLRVQLSRCKTAQDEVNFEVSLSALPPLAMKPISVRYMAELVQNIITLVGACENKFVLVGNEDHHGDLLEYQEKRVLVPPNSQSGIAQRTQPISLAEQKGSRHKEQVDRVRPLREIEAGSSQLLELTLQQIRLPVQDLQKSMKDAVDLLIPCLAYCFDVPTLPSGEPAPKDVRLEEIDLRIDGFSTRLATFDVGSAEALKQAMLDGSKGAVDFMPRMETFLVSSFILALRDSATQILQMLQHARSLVEKRQRRRNRLQIWIPQYRNIRKWLTTGGEADGMVLPEGAKQATRQGLGNSSRGEKDEASTDETSSPSIAGDEESSPPATNGPNHTEKPARSRKVTRGNKKSSAKGFVARSRVAMADGMEWAQRSDDVKYALKLAVAVLLVTWPAFVASWNAWYSEVKGVWAPMQLILVFEVAIGTSLFAFAIRLLGVIFGCIVGYLSVEISRGSRPAAVVVLLFGIIPSVYVQVGTKYVKAGMISIVSLAVVGLGEYCGLSFCNYGD
jgi:hypothetical protein